MKLRKITGKLSIINRLNNSVNGNPRFVVEIDNNTICTKSDYSYSYNIENLANKNAMVEAYIYDTKLSTRLERITEIK